MSAVAEQHAVIFPDDFDEQSAYETPLRGYLSGVIVRTADGRRFPLFFIDPVRLGQDLEANVGLGRPFVAETNLIVVPEVTVATIEQTVAELVRQRFFDNLKPLA
jgi:hypothetical protein